VRVSLFAEEASNYGSRICTWSSAPVQENLHFIPAILHFLFHPSHSLGQLLSGQIVCHRQGAWYIHLLSAVFVRLAEHQFEPTKLVC